MNQPENTNTKAKTLLAGVTLGLIIGGLLGFVFAPAKGSDSRRKLFTLFEDENNNTTEDLMDDFDPESDRPV